LSTAYISEWPRIFVSRTSSRHCLSLAVK
jgi:hypothetical protein